ncbi:hypothetical protein CsSME_00037485 [Camellia sinensis var. sinensis]
MSFGDSLVRSLSFSKPSQWIDSSLADSSQNDTISVILLGDFDFDFDFEVLSRFQFRNLFERFQFRSSTATTVCTGSISLISISSESLISISILILKLHRHHHLHQQGLSGGVIARISIAGVAEVLLLAVCIYVGVYKKKKVQDKILLLQDLNINQFKLQGVEIARPSNLSATPVHLNIQDDHVVIDNGILQLALSNPGGTVTGITYGGIDNLIELHNQELNGGFWDLNWSEAGSPGM